MHQLGEDGRFLTESLEDNVQHVSSIPANGIFLTKNKKNKKKMPNGWRTINSLVNKIRLHGRRGKGMAESFSRQKSRHAPQKEGGLKILCDLPPV